MTRWTMPRSSGPGDERLDAVSGEPVAVEVLLHRERSAEQAQAREAGALHGNGGGVADVQQGDDHR